MMPSSYPIRRYLFTLVICSATFNAFCFNIQVSKRKELLTKNQKWSEAFCHYKRSTIHVIRALNIPEQIRQDAVQSLVVDDVPSDFKQFFGSITNATSPRGANKINQGHDSFRYEWGTWVEEANLRYCMDQIDSIRLQSGAYEYLQEKFDTSSRDVNKQQPLRIQLADGQDWNCYLHVLPEATSWEGRWPTGSWTMLKTLTGMATIAAMKGPDRNGNFVPKTKRNLVGGSDGSFGSGQSSSGEDCIKYVGGPLRRYTGQFGKTVILEVVVRPPIGFDSEQYNDGYLGVDDFNKLLTIVNNEKLVAEEEHLRNIDSTSPSNPANLGMKIGITFDQVGGLDVQLDTIARRILASRANPAAARKLGVSHVRGVLLSGPPGCGKTLLARELARLLGAREPQIVNGPEILDKYIGEAEKKVRELFIPAETEYNLFGDDSALHLIIFDEMDAIARKRGTMTSDTTGVRDSVVNQLLAKMDGVRQASNILVVGLTNRPELLDPALLRPGRLEVHLRIELPDLTGRRDILRIHTRQMNEAGGLSQGAIDVLEDTSDHGIPSRTEHFSGAELAGLVRSAASFALARMLETPNSEDVVVTVADIERALGEVRPALGKDIDSLKVRFPNGISIYSPSVQRVQRELRRFISYDTFGSPRVESLLLVGGTNGGGSGSTALAAWAAFTASAEYVRFITALDLFTSDSNGDEGRAAALVDRFVEAREMSTSLLVIDDIDQLCAGNGLNGYSNVMLSTLRALMRSPPAASKFNDAGTSSTRNPNTGKAMKVIATTSRPNAACDTLHLLFDETIGMSCDRLTSISICFLSLPSLVA
jgi:SpoVK/Ycf46/Vps4 family AAA+-type ATPase